METPKRWSLCCKYDFYFPSLVTFLFFGTDRFTDVHICFFFLENSHFSFLFCLLFLKKRVRKDQHTIHLFNFVCFENLSFVVSATLQEETKQKRQTVSSSRNGLFVLKPNFHNFYPPQHILIVQLSSTPPPTTPLSRVTG